MKNFIFLIAAITLFISYNLKAEDSDNLVKLDMYSNVKQIQVGSDFFIAIKLDVADEWHIYWKNPGDSGLPTEVKWTLPKGVEADGGLIWQVPERIAWSGMVNYGFEHDVYLIQKFKTSRLIDAESLKIKAHVNWLICKEKCIPQDKKIEISIAVGEMFEKSEYSKMIQDLLASAPKQFKTTKSYFKSDDENLEVKLTDMPSDVAQIIDLYLITDSVTDNTVNAKVENGNNKATAKFKLSPYLDVVPAEIELLVLYKDKNGNNKSYETIIKNSK